MDGQAESGYNGEQGYENSGTEYIKGSNIPQDIKKTKPLYSPNIEKWLGNGGKINIENGTWKYSNLEGISVTYKNGYPDFKGSGLVYQEVDIGEFRSYKDDYIRADEMAPNGSRSPINTWHHSEDGRTLQEVNRRIHEMFTHKGGMSIKGGE